jgi:antirestriction protein
MANLDTRDLASELEEIEEAIEDGSEVEWRELPILEARDEIRELLEEVDPNGDGETLISEDDFEEHARELAEEIGAVEDFSAWPCTAIDWKQAASDLQMDYSTVTFDGTDYYYRGG